VHDGQAGKRLVMETRNKQCLLGRHLCGVVGEPEGVGTNDYPVVPFCVRAQVRAKGTAIDAVTDPDLLYVAGYLAAPTDHCLGTKEKICAAFSVYGEKMHLEIADLATSGRKFVHPCEMILGTGNQETDTAAMGGKAFGKVSQKRLSPANRSGVSKARTNKGNIFRR